MFWILYHVRTNQFDGFGQVRPVFIENARKSLILIEKIRLLSFAIYYYLVQHLIHDRL